MGVCSDLVFVLIGCLFCVKQVFPAECNAFPGRVPANGSVFYSRALDKAFAESIGGLMWPRGFVAAGSFYRFDATVNVSSDGFVRRFVAFAKLLFSSKLKKNLPLISIEKPLRTSCHQRTGEEDASDEQHNEGAGGVALPERLRVQLLQQLRAQAVQRQVHDAQRAARLVWGELQVGSKKVMIPVSTFDLSCIATGLRVSTNSVWGELQRGAGGFLQCAGASTERDA